MTFNAKKHTETERRWSRDSAGPFIYCTLPERALNAGLCMCDCRLRAHLQNQGHVLLLTKKKMSAVSITGLVFPSSCVCLCWCEVGWSAESLWGLGSDPGQRSKVGREKQTRRAGWQAWESLYKLHSVWKKGDLFSPWNSRTRVKFTHSYVVSFICFIKMKSSVCKGTRSSSSLNDTRFVGFIMILRSKRAWFWFIWR